MTGFAADMTSENTAALAARLVDARGHRCPMPTLRLRKALEDLAPGEAVELWATDPMAKIDVPHFCVAQGHGCRRLDGDDPLRFWVVKQAGDQPG